MSELEWPVVGRLMTPGGGVPVPGLHVQISKQFENPRGLIHLSSRDLLYSYICVYEFLYPQVHVDMYTHRTARSSCQMRSAATLKQNLIKKGNCITIWICRNS